MRGFAHHRLRYQIDVVFRHRPDLEILLQKDRILIYRDLAAAIVNRVRRVGMDEGFFRDDPGLLTSGECFRRSRRENLGKQEEALRDAEARPENAPDQKCRDPAPHHLSPWYSRLTTLLQTDSISCAVHPPSLFELRVVSQPEISSADRLSRALRNFGVGGLIIVLVPSTKDRHRSAACAAPTPRWAGGNPYSAVRGS